MALGVFVFASSTVAAAAEFRLWQHPQQSNHPAPVVRVAPPTHPAPAPKTPPPGNTFAPRSGQNQEHLAQWMQSHSTLPLDQQQRALDTEPGFSQLPAEQQQHMHDRLAQLNRMTPEQRQHAIQHTEAMEALPPERRQQVRSALVDLGALPEDRRRLVSRTFRALRPLPDGQRQAYLDSPAMRGQFTPQERATLNNLFEVAPYLPPPPPAQQSPR
jgi:hypothetical protein